MKVLCVDHITINCKDLEKSIQFYTNVIGLKKLNTVDMGDHVLYYFQLPSAMRLELICYKDKQKLVKTGATDVGVYRHLALKVYDLNSVFEACKNFNGVKIRLEPTYIDNIKCTVALVEDPNGVEVELVQA